MPIGTATTELERKTRAVVLAPIGVTPPARWFDAHMTPDAIMRHVLADVEALERQRLQ
ncbi:MAG: hypothetical protein AB7K09_20400 [Planctomycetota bacterium]